MMKKLVMLSAAIALSGCSVFGGKGDEIVFDTVLGPETEDHIKTLPSNLEGDTANAQYSTVQNKGRHMESGDGTD